MNRSEAMAMVGNILFEYWDELPEPKQKYVEWYYDSFFDELANLLDKGVDDGRQRTGEVRKP